MLRNIGKMAMEELALEDWLPPLGTYPLKEEVGMGVTCVTLRMFPSKGRYVGHIQWESMMKFPTVWANLYGSGVLVLGDTNYSRDGVKFT